MRNIVMSAAGALAAVSLAAACASNPTPAAKAAQVERVQCPDTPDAVALMRSTTVLSSEPIYSHVMTSNNSSEERVCGAKLIVRPPAGVSAEAMTRALQCHSARVVLGAAAAVQDDPTLLPDGWVDIDVKPEEGNFAITLSADTVRENLQVLGRATRYAGEHQLATQPGL